MSLAYLDWVRGKPCVICGEPGEPSHMIAIGMGGNRKKPSIKHFLALAKCRLHHREFHDYGLEWVNNKYNIDLWKEAAKQEAEFLWEWTKQKEDENDE